MKTYTINQLSETAQQRAVEDYMDRTWCGDIANEVIVAAMNNECYSFSKSGKLLNN